MSKSPSIHNWLNEDFQPPEPWETLKQSLFEYLLNNDDYVELSSDWDKQVATIALPDEDEFQNEHNIIYQYPAAARHESIKIDDQKSAEDDYFYLILDYLRKAMKKPSPKRVATFYKNIKNTTLLHAHRQMDTEFNNWEDEDIITITAIARWLVLNSPDRNCAKFGLLLLALFPFEEDDYIFYAFQKHEEFAPYCLQRLLRQPNYDYITPEEFEIDTLILYTRSSGYGRHYILQSITEDNYNNKFDSLIDKLFFAGPPIRWANTETAYVFIQNVNIEKYLDEEFPDEMAIQSILLITKNLMIPNMETTLDFFDIPNSIEILEKPVDRMDNTALNITKICLLQRIMDYLRTCTPPNSSAPLTSRIRAIHNAAKETKIKHLETWKTLVREHIDTNGPDFPRVLNHLANELHMEKETGGNWNNAMKFLRIGNNVMRDVTLYDAKNMDDFIETIKTIYKCNPKPENWHSAKQFITAKDRDKKIRKFTKNMINQRA